MRGWLTLLAVVVATGTALADDPTVKVDPTKPPPPPPDPDAPKQWDPVRWQTPDGTTVTFVIAAKRAEKPKLGITHGDESYDLALPDSFKDMVPAFVAIEDEIVITTGATPGVAWRYAWKKGRIAQTKHVYWAKDKARPSWAANTPPANASAALTRIVGLLRFGGTAPGLTQFFADANVTWNVFTRGDAKPWKRTMTGKEALHKWVGAGYPVVRGKLKIAKGCVTLPANVDGKPAAPAAPPDAPHLTRLCVDKDLHVTEIETLIATQPDGSKPSAVMP